MRANKVNKLLHIFLSLSLGLSLILSSPGIVGAVTFTSAFDVLKSQYPDIITRLNANGASDAEIRAFLNDLQTDVASRGGLTDSNFDSMLYDSLEYVIQLHPAVFQALFDGFSDEIKYTLKNKTLHPSLMPLRNSVYTILMSNNTPPVTPPAGGGGQPPNQDEEKKTPDNEKQNLDEQTVKNANPNTVNISFADLDGHWAKDGIMEMVSLGLVGGVGDSKFDPDRKITRAEFTVILVGAIGLQDSSVVRGRFTDVPADKWYFQAVNAAAQAGIVNGCTPDEFYPDMEITREQIAVIIAQTLVYKNKATALSQDQVQENLKAYEDEASISPWARNSVALVVSKGIMKGRTLTSFAPGEPATRAEATIMILQLYRQLNPGS
ncbi:MAG: S-layer homology domain-containing protein [Syntrophomonas sp.]